MATENETIEARRKYHREWRARNKDKVHEYNARYWVSVADRAKTTQAQEEGDLSRTKN